MQRYLTVDLPPMSLFKSDSGAGGVPQEYLDDLLNKYNGEQTAKSGNDQLKFTLRTLPPVLIIAVKRFLKNNYFMEKNPSVIVSPIEHGIDFGRCNFLSPSVAGCSKLSALQTDLQRSTRRQAARRLLSLHGTGEVSRRLDGVPRPLFQRNSRDSSPSMSFLPSVF